MDIQRHKYNIAQYLRKTNLELYEEVNSLPGKTFAEKYYKYTHPESGICKTCGKPTKFINITSGFREYCSPQCSNCNKDKIEKTALHNLKTYGVRSTAQSQIVKDKAEQTCLHRYGAKCSSQSQIVKDKVRQNNLDKYGCHPSQLPNVRAKISLGRLKHQIGLDENVVANDGSVLIIKCPHPNCNHCSEKIFEITNINYYNRKSYGCELCTKLFPIGSANRGVSIKSQQYFQLLDEKLKNYTTYYASKNSEYTVGKYKLDYYIKELKIAIEYNGTYFHADPTIYHENDMICMFGTYKLAGDIWMHDAKKIQYLVDNGITVYVVWEGRETEINKLIMDILNTKLCAK